MYIGNENAPLKLISMVLGSNYRVFYVVVVPRSTSACSSRKKFAYFFAEQYFSWSGVCKVPPFHVLLQNGEAKLSFFSYISDVELMVRQSYWNFVKI